MAKIFEREEAIIVHYDQLLVNGKVENPNDQMVVHELVEEYRILLDSLKRMDKLVGLMEAKMHVTLNSVYEYSKLDELLNIHSRQYFDEMLQKEFKCCLRSEDHLSLMIIDVDEFESYNEIYGKLEGDICLTMIADEIQGLSRRPRDVVARYEGDSFVVLMPETDGNGAVLLAEKVKAAVEGLKKHHMGSSEFGKITVTIGVSTMFPKPNNEHFSLVSKTEEVLAIAKKGNGNTIRFK